MWSGKAVSFILLTHLVMCATDSLLAGDQSATLVGAVEDAQTGGALPGATVLVLNTGLGASSDVDGKFIIRNVPSGSHTLRAVYVGYVSLESAVTVRDGETRRVDFQLKAAGVDGEEVVVTAQAAGQKGAINQQLSALSIVNVVSRDRIQELPDANAAESVSRLPGVSIIRTGGEGAKVVIRGLSPQYNQVTIDGVELPSNVASGNTIFGNPADGGGLVRSGESLGDRGEDLSMISSGMLGGITVTKAITPDMDAAVIGGVVDFGLRKAARTESAPESEQRWLPKVELKAEGGYTKLKNSYDNYRYMGSMEERFFNQSLGIYVQGTAEKRNLSANVLGANYVLNDKSQGGVPLPSITTLNLNDVYRNRERYGGTLVLDYEYETGEVAMMNFLSTSKTQEIVRGQTINLLSNSPYDALVYTPSETNNELNVIGNLLSFKQEFSGFHTDLKLSHSYTESRNPEDLYANFFQDKSLGLFSNLGDPTRVDPKTLASAVIYYDSSSMLDAFWTTATLSRERTITASADLATDLALGTRVSAHIKAGGMFQHRTRAFDVNLWGFGFMSLNHNPATTEYLQQVFPWLVRDEEGRLMMSSFLPDSYQYGEFLNGEYTLGPPLNVERLWEVIHRAKTVYSPDPNTMETVVNDYSGDENKSAGYAMVTLDLGQDLSLIPGVRYQNLTTKYTAMRGMIVPGGFQGGDTTVSHAHGYWLPMVHARYRPFEWLQLHLAYTNTLNYPDYGTLTPRYVISTSYIDYNNHALKPAISQNLDLVVSFLSKEIGLLSFNGFRKRIKDLVFFSTMYVSDLSAYPDLPQGGKQLFTLRTYINNPNPVDLFGLEVEWQTHFWYLPKPLDGLVVNANYTHIFSEAQYPRSETDVHYDDEGNSVTTVRNTFYSDRLINQPNEIVNLAAGYDYGGFSLRVSMLYQDKVFKRPDFWLQQRVNSAKFTRWDLSVKQDLPWLGMQLFFNANNITGEDDIDVNQKNGYPASQQRYGMSADVGMQIRF